MTQELKEQIARNAASGWCRCFKCDGTVRNTNSNTNSQCDKDKLITCNQWYNGYKAALLALDDDRLRVNFPPNVGVAAVISADEAIKQPRDYSISAKADWLNAYSEGFEEGAEWMASQGESYKVTVQSPVIGPPLVCCPAFPYEDGDEVIVQIRKHNYDPTTTH